MNVPIFNAEQALGATVRRYRGRNSYGSQPASEAVSPQQFDEEDVFDEEDDENELGEWADFEEVL